MITIQTFFELMGEFLVDFLRLDRPGKGKAGLQQDLVSLSVGKKSVIKKYYGKKLKIFLTILMTGFLISAVGFVLYSTVEPQTETKMLERPDYGGSDRKESLTVQIEDRESAEQVEISVQARKYSDEEKQQFLDQALTELESQLPGENDSLDEVRKQLCLPETLQDGKVTVSWMTLPYGVIGSDGSIKPNDQEDGTLVELRATLLCDDRELQYLAYAHVYPPVLSEEEQVRQWIQDEVQQADERDRSESTLSLPEQLNGKSLTWSREKHNPVPAILILTLLTAVGVYVEMDSNVRKKAENRRYQLLLDYPDLMWKMTMLLGAGLTIKGTFIRISEEYRREKAAVGRKPRRKLPDRYVYEEVMYTCYEMESGISEAQAYERFGKRCQLPEYIRLGSVLSQNLRKGAKGLTETLQLEAESSMNDRKNHARKIGEQAGTKLLLPMVLMLGIVLVVLMVPAFLSF